MFILMVVIFVLGYIAIALEHPLKVDKAATALLIGALTWVTFMVGGTDIIDSFKGISGHVQKGWDDYMLHNPNGTFSNWVSHHELLAHLGEISEILFFLLGAMTIVEIVDQHEGFRLITDKIRTTKKVKLLWIISIIAFFMSAVLDNLTTTIVMVALLRKLVSTKQDRWFYASMIVLAANAGGAWSPIGDVTTIMLWIKGQVTTIPIIRDVFLPSVAAAVVPLIILSFKMKGNVERPLENHDEEGNGTPVWESNLIFFMGVGALLFVPVFKTVTHLPPYLGMLFGLGVIWTITEIMHRGKTKEIKKKLTVVAILRRIDVPTVLFFLGILLAVSSLQSAGQLTLLATWLDEVTNKNLYIINLAIGFLSAIVDNVPLVAGAMGMYDIAPAGTTGEMAAFMVDGRFWQFLAYCAGTGGSMLIIGSAAGVAAMGMEKIDFIWYLKKISLLALSGYLAGALVFYLMFGI